MSKPPSSAALGHAAQVDLHTLRQGGAGPILHDLGIVHHGKQGGDFLFLRHGIFPGGKAPGPQYGIGGDIQRAAGALTHAQRCAQQVCRLRGQLRRPVMVQGGNLAGPVRHRPQPLQLPHAGLRLVQQAPVPALVQPQGHHRVHGEKGALQGLGGGAAVRQEQERGQKKGKHAFHVKRAGGTPHCAASGMESSRSIHSRSTSTTR